MLHARLRQRLRADAAALDKHGVQRIRAALNHAFAVIDDRYVMPLVDQPLRQGKPHLAAANHDNTHNCLLFSLHRR